MTEPRTWKKLADKPDDYRWSMRYGNIAISGAALAGLGGAMVFGFGGLFLVLGTALFVIGLAASLEKD